MNGFEKITKQTTKGTKGTKEFLNWLIYGVKPIELKNDFIKNRPELEELKKAQNLFIGLESTIKKFNYFYTDIYKIIKRIDGFYLKNSETKEIISFLGKPTNKESIIVKRALAFINREYNKENE